MNPTITATVEYEDASYRVTNDLSTNDRLFRVYQPGNGKVGFLATAYTIEEALFALTTLRQQGKA